MTYCADGRGRRFKVPKPAYNREARAWDIRRVFISLLRCCRISATDAAPIFYRQNTFVISGDHGYYRIIAWLDKIGYCNRANLSALEISVADPDGVWRLPSGTRIEPWELPDDTCVPGSNSTHESLAPRRTQLPEGEVNVINPAIETIISFFAHDDCLLKIRLVFQLEWGQIPGMCFHEDTGDQSGKVFTMDLPNLVEKWRTDYTFGCMEILWRGDFTKCILLRDRDLIESLGWEILEEKSMNRPWYTHARANDHGRNGYRKSEFLLKRKPITGPLLASDTEAQIRVRQQICKQQSVRRATQRAEAEEWEISQAEEISALTSR
ncbi:MAG: hypothetical protein Q9168_006846 [Polycauliona sp. 1 TL-2023]